MKKMLILFLLSGIFFTCYSQNAGPGSWTTLNAKIPGKNKWSGYTELQLRSLGLYSRFYYYEIKGGVTYTPNAIIAFTFGTGVYNTFHGGPQYDDYKEQTEFRTWQQAVMNQTISSVQIQHRYRIEQRFTSTYANRFRYKLEASVPLNSRKIKPQTFYAVANNELFFGDKIPHFTRNRFYAGGGYVFSKNLAVQAGLLRQVDFLKQSTRRKNYFFTGFNITL